MPLRRTHHIATPTNRQPQVLENIDVPIGSIPPYTRADLNPHTDPADRPSNATYDRFVYLMICARNRSYSEHLISRAEGGCPFLIEDVFFNSLLAQVLPRICPGSA